MPVSSLSLPRVGATADDAFGVTLMDVLEHGERYRQGSTSLSVGSGRECMEILNYSVRVESPRDRLIFNSSRRLSLPGAVARFIWMMAASDRLADIAFYWEDKVRAFSDDGISVPGSNYGQRILSARPGLNQLQSVIKRLREDRSSRRAALSVYQAEDAVRDSKDIPCTFGIFYHIRNGVLCSTTLMRSNNAFVLLPYNIFEFSLLAEVVAAEVGVPLGPLTHHAVSMHLYEQDYAKAKDVVDVWKSGSVGGAACAMPEIPRRSSCLDQIRELIILEANLRHGSAGLRGANIEDWIDRGSAPLDSYWRQLYFLLLLFVAKKNDDQQALSALESVIEEPWLSYLPADYFAAGSSEAKHSGLVLRQPEQSGPLNVIPLFSSRAMKSLKGRVAEWEHRKGQSLSWPQYASLQENLLETLAARGGSGFEDEISDDDFEHALLIVTRTDV